MSTVEIPLDVPGQINLVLQTLQAVVDEAGHDYVYRRHNAAYSCMYIHPATGQPDCNVARVLYRLGVSVETLTRHEGDAVLGFDANELLGLHQAALEVLQAAQKAQDVGQTWGEALIRARTMARTVIGTSHDG